MKNVIVLVLLGTIAAVAVGGNDPAETVNHLFATFDRPGSPGCSVGVIRNGSFIYKKSFGYASLELDVPLRPDSVFYMGSVSKQFTAASIVLAAEQGYLSLDDDVRKYLPELPDYGHRITLRQMLHQTSGFRDFLDLISLSGRSAAGITRATDIFKLIARQKGLNNIPGTEWIYSNSNYFLLGEVIRRATKKSLARFASENIFQPLGMTHTLFYDDNTVVVPNRVAAYDPDKKGGFLVNWSTTYDIVGGGGMMSTANDLLLWDRNFYSNKLGKGPLLKELESHGVLNNGNRIDYAMGLSLGSYRGLPTVEHNGALFGYRTEFLRFPQQRFSVIVLCNVSSSKPESLARKIADTYLDGDFTPGAVALNPSAGLPDPSAFAGTYLDPRTKAVYKFTVARGNLLGWGVVLRRINANTYYDLGNGVISFDKKNDNMHASLRIPGELYFSGKRIKPLQLSAAELTRFEGDFHSEELDTIYTLSVQDGRLTVKYSDHPRVALDAVAPDEFCDTGFGTIVFDVGANHRVPGFRLFTHAARGIIFTGAKRKVRSRLD